MFGILNVLNVTARKDRFGFPFGFERDLRFLGPTEVGPKVSEDGSAISKSEEGIFPSVNYQNYGNGSVQSRGYQPYTQNNGYQQNDQGYMYQPSSYHQPNYNQPYNNPVNPQSNTNRWPQYSAAQAASPTPVNSGLLSIIEPSSISSIAQLGIQGIASIRESKKLTKSLNENLSYIPVDVDVPSADGKKHYFKKMMDCADAENGLCCLMPNYCHMYAECDSDVNLNVHLASVLAAVPRCQCKPGFIGDGRTKGTGCQNIDECASRTHRCDHQCTDSIPGYICTCHEGYKLAADLRSCNDIDECATGYHKCSDICINIPGSYKCGCRPGYALGKDGLSCEEIDECRVMSELLQNLATVDPELVDILIPCKFPDLCSNREGSFTCGCPSGYTQEGNKCVDIDECQQDYRCPRNTKCVNSDGYYECLCDSGYRTSTPTIYEPVKDTLGFVEASVHQNFYEEVTHRSVSLECTDIDECDANIRDTCPYNDWKGKKPSCLNKEGSYICDCDEYRDEATVSDPTSDSWEIKLERIYEKGSGCVIPGACADSICGENSLCEFKAGVQLCTCLEGYWNMDNHCVDFDECSIFKELTVNQAEVWDRAGDVKQYSGGCFVDCINMSPGYSCTCPSGYERGDDDQCHDTDECSESCRGGCINMNGSYMCACPPGYQASTFGDSNYAEESIVDYYQTIHDQTYTNKKWNSYILDQSQIEELWRQFLKLDSKKYCWPLNYCDERVDASPLRNHCKGKQTCRDRRTLIPDYEINQPMICGCGDGYETVVNNSVPDTLTGGIIKNSICVDIDECLIAKRAIDMGTKLDTCKKNRPCCQNTPGGFKCARTVKHTCRYGALHLYEF